MELLVAVVLMLILVAAVARIFKHTSDAMVLAEGTMAATQNARAVMDLITRDLSSVQLGDGAGAFVVRRPSDVVGSANGFLEFETISSWMEGGTAGEGVAQVKYRLERDSGGRCVLYRDIKVPSGSTLTGVLGQYIALDDADNPVMIVEYLDGKNKQFKLPDAGKSFSCDTSNREEFPSGIRISVDFTDRGRRVVRPFLHTFWVATGLN